jgi:hypothetical protein
MVWLDVCVVAINIHSGGADAVTGRIVVIKLNFRDPTIEILPPLTLGADRQGDRSPGWPLIVSRKSPR